MKKLTEILTEVFNAAEVSERFVKIKHNRIEYYIEMTSDGNTTGDVYEIADNPRPMDMLQQVDEYELFSEKERTKIFTLARKKFRENK